MPVSADTDPAEVRPNLEFETHAIEWGSSEIGKCRFVRPTRNEPPVMIEFQNISERFPDGTLAVDDFSLVRPSLACSKSLGVILGPDCGRATREPGQLFP